MISHAPVLLLNAHSLIPPIAQGQAQARILEQAQRDFADILTRLQIGDGAFVDANGVHHQANSKRDLLVAALAPKNKLSNFSNYECK